MIDIISKRIDAYGRWHTIGMRDRQQHDAGIRSEIDAFVTSLSMPGVMILSGIGERWHEIEESEARDTLTDILSHDLAYRTPEIPQPEASLIAQDFLTLFGDESRFFSNGTFDRERGGWGGYGQVANATFETGVVVVGKAKIGMLWCHDED